MNKDEQKRLADEAMTIKDYCKSREFLSEVCDGCIFEQTIGCLLTNDWTSNWKLKKRLIYKEVFLKAFPKAYLHTGTFTICRNEIFEGYRNSCIGKTCNVCWNETAPEEYQEENN